MKELDKKRRLALTAVFRSRDNVRNVQMALFAVGTGFAIYVANHFG